MSLSRISRRWVASFALVSYLLAATVSGMFHQHGGECCSADRCAAGPETKSSACTHGHRHAHRGAQAPLAQRHPGHRHAAGEVDASQRTGTPNRTPVRSPGPLRHADCAACQFLAEQSITTPQFVLEVTSFVVPHEALAPLPSVPTVVADAHPPRGPPAHS